MIQLNLLIEGEHGDYIYTLRNNMKKLFLLVLILWCGNELYCVENGRFPLINPSSVPQIPKVIVRLPETEYAIKTAKKAFLPRIGQRYLLSQPRKAVWRLTPEKDEQKKIKENFELYYIRNKQIQLKGRAFDDDNFEEKMEKLEEKKQNLDRIWSNINLAFIDVRFPSLLYR